jgi:hypothetical protein
MPTARIPRARSLAGSLVSVLAAVAAGVAGESSTGSAPPVGLEPPGGALVAPGPAAPITLLYTGDVIGFLDPCG